MSARCLVVVCPHWPLVAAGVAVDEPALVLEANRVVAASPAARREGAVPGLRRREAQSRCPAARLIEHDPARDARWFEPVVAAVSAFTPRVEVDRPGRCLIPTRGPSRYFGGDVALAGQVAEAVDRAVAEILTRGRPDEPLDPRLACRIGVADGPVAARLVAGLDRVSDPAPLLAAGSNRLVVAPGRTAELLAPLPVGLLHPPAPTELIDLLVRLGLESVGAFARLPESDVTARFGPEGVLAHRLARGDDPRPLDLRPVPDDLAVEVHLDPPAEQVEVAAFAVREPAGRLLDSLAGRGLAATCVVIEAETTRGERLERRWRHEGALGVAELADRVRWQLEGWLMAAPATRPSGGLVRLGVRPDEVRADRGRQLGFWGAEARPSERLERAVTRLVGLLGPEAVTVAELRGGRSPADRVSRVPVVAVELSGRQLVRAEHHDEPWPGRLPGPSPATLPLDPEPVELLDGAGVEVEVGRRGGLSAMPVRLRWAGRTFEVQGWVGPWLADERWWDTSRHRRRARLQLLLADSRALLVTREDGRWWCEARYE